MYPRITYDLPILSMDLVANNDMVSGLSGRGRRVSRWAELVYIACDMWTHGGRRVWCGVELAGSLRRSWLLEAGIPEPRPCKSHFLPLWMQVSLAIVDPCPVTPNLQLPPFYEAPVRCAPRSLGCCNAGEAFAATACAVSLTPHLLCLFAHSNLPRRQLQARYQLENNRSIPPWGQAIFSPCCVIMRPQGGEDLGRFLKYALALTQMHVQVRL